MYTEEATSLNSCLSCHSQEFVEAQRTVRSGPSTSFSREPLREIADLVAPGAHNAEAAGYITFALEMRHLEAVCPVV